MFNMSVCLHIMSEPIAQQLGFQNSINYHVTARDLKERSELMFVCEVYNKETGLVCVEGHFSLITKIFNQVNLILKF